MGVESAVGIVTAGGLVLYDVRSCTRAQAADNKAYVSSLTAGKTYRVAGNLDRTWEISLYAKTGEVDIPAELQAGKEISVQIPSGAKDEVMLIDSSSLEVDIESGELLGISLSCSATKSTSYPAMP